MGDRGGKILRLGFYMMLQTAIEIFDIPILPYIHKLHGYDMVLNNDRARKVWFSGFNEWQSRFNQMLARCTAEGVNPAQLKSLGKTFMRDVMVPFMDAAKDRLLIEIAKDVQGLGEKAKKLDGYVNKDNK